jgi:hypothetical protein
LAAISLATARGENGLGDFGVICSIPPLESLLKSHPYIECSDSKKYTNFSFVNLQKINNTCIPYKYWINLVGIKRN